MRSINIERERGSLIKSATLIVPNYTKHFVLAKNLLQQNGGLKFNFLFATFRLLWAELRRASAMKSTKSWKTLVTHTYCSFFFVHATCLLDSLCLV